MKDEHLINLVIAVSAVALILDVVGVCTTSVPLGTLIMDPIAAGALVGAPVLFGWGIYIKYYGVFGEMIGEERKASGSGETESDNGLELDVNASDTSGSGDIVNSLNNISDFSEYTFSDALSTYLYHIVSFHNITMLLIVIISIIIYNCFARTIINYTPSKYELNNEILGNRRYDYYIIQDFYYTWAILLKRSHKKLSKINLYNLWKMNI